MISCFRIIWLAGHVYLTTTTERRQAENPSVQTLKRSGYQFGNRPMPGRSWASALHRRDFASLHHISLASSPTASGRNPPPVYKLMESLPTVLLRPGEADRVVAGHPWIYQGSILRLTQPAADGDIVQVKDHRQRFLGIGLYNSQSKINVRLIARDRVAVDQLFFTDRIRSALDV